jgi:hypothetical protein
MRVRGFIVIAQGLLYTRHTSNIHQLVLQDVRAATIAEFAERLKAIMGETPDGEVMRLSIQVSAIPSIQYMLGMTRDIKAARPKAIRSRIAVIYGPSLQLSLLNMIVRAIVRTSAMKLFPKKDEAEAHEWLLK